MSTIEPDRHTPLLILLRARIRLYKPDRIETWSEPYEKTPDKHRFHIRFLSPAAKWQPCIEAGPKQDKLIDQVHGTIREQGYIESPDTPGLFIRNPFTNPKKPKP